jgi:hypothetical protein
VPWPTSGAECTIRWVDHRVYDRKMKGIGSELADCSLGDRSVAFDTVVREEPPDEDEEEDEPDEEDDRDDEDEDEDDGDSDGYSE